MSASAVRIPWKPSLVLLALAFLYWNVVLKLVRHWWTDENYSHGLLIPFVIAFILWSERERLVASAMGSSLLVGISIVGISCLMLIAGTVGAELFLQRMSLVFMLVGVAIYFQGTAVLRVVLVPALLLALAVPIPTIIFNKIAFPLQLFASRCAVWAMHTIHIPVLRLGNVIELMPRGSRETQKLEVVEACSGIRSLMTLVTLAVVLAYLTSPDNRNEKSEKNWTAHFLSFGFCRALVIVASAVPIAILTNAMRVSGTGVLAHYYGTKVADGFFHTFSGWVIYVVAFVLLVSVGWIIDRLWNRLFKSSPIQGSTRSNDAEIDAVESGRGGA